MTASGWPPPQPRPGATQGTTPAWPAPTARPAASPYAVRPPAGFQTAYRAPAATPYPQARPTWQAPVQWPAPTGQPAGQPWAAAARPVQAVPAAPVTQWPAPAVQRPGTTTQWPAPTGQPVTATATRWAAPTGQPAGQAWPAPYPQGAPTVTPYQTGYGQGGWYPAPTPPPKPRQTGLRAVIVVLVVLVVIGPTLLTAIKGLGQSTGSTTPSRAPTTAATGGPTTRGQPTASTGPTVGPTRTETTGPADPTATSGPRTDEWPIDLNPPDVPYPRTWSDLDYYLVANPVYDQAIAPVPCEVGDIDLTSAPIGDIQAYMTNLVACLMDSWDNAVEGAGFVLPRPSITVYDAEIMTKCGESISLNAFYCSADQQMYYSYDLVQLFSWDLQRARYVAEAVIAHEFGHAVQGRTGILESEDYRAADAATEEESYEWSRRAELQADCFAGLFLRSIAASTGMLDSDHENARQVFYQLGDPYVGGDHGQPDSRSAWFESGFGSDSVGACRTYDAASESVT